MSTPNLVPRGDLTGSIGTVTKRWLSGSFAHISGAFFGDGSGLLNVVSTVAPAGSTGDIQFNDADSSTSGSVNFRFDKSSNTVYLTGSLNSNGGFTRKTTRVEASSYTVTSADYRIGVSWTDSGSVNVQLPLISSVGKIEYKIKDEHGNASVNNIHIITSGSDRIDGEVTQSMAVNYMSVGLYNDGISKWFIE